MEIGNVRLPDVKDGFTSFLHGILPGKSQLLRNVIAFLWYVIVLLLALFGFLEPQAEFHYLAM
jgi:hypothetical protein